MDMEVFEKYESEVRSYCRSFPTVFERAEGARLYDREGRDYIDFFAGAGVLNYGHNNPRLKKKLLDYLTDNGVTHGLDMATVAKEKLLTRFNEVILELRGLTYKIQFPGPTGTNAVESALKLARKVTGRDKVMFFTNAFHGMTLGALSVTGNGFKREGAGISLSNGVCMPYGGYLGQDADTINYISRFLEDSGSGIDVPAAVIVETVQAEGGLNMASFQWLQKLESLCREHDVLLIVDDIQVGCGRTGPFFSFEQAGIEPDIVCLSKSISGYGLPLALVLIKPELDQWEPGEHNGTFRGHNLAFVTATEALGYWVDDSLQKQTERKARRMRQFLQSLKKRYDGLTGDQRGRGLIQGIECPTEGVASEISREAFERGLIVETSGPSSEVVKLLPPLVIPDEDMERGFEILEKAVGAVAERHAASRVENIAS